MMTKVAFNDLCCVIPQTKVAHFSLLSSHNITVLTWAEGVGGERGVANARTSNLEVFSS